MRVRTLGALLGVSALLSATPALACDPIPVGLNSVSPHVSPNGTLSLLFSCGTEACTADASSSRFRVLDEAGNELPGSIVKSGVAGYVQWAVWRPTQPFVANARFTAEQENAQSLGFDSSAPSFDPKSLEVSFRALPSDVPEGDEICCDPTPQAMSCYGRPCFQKQRQGAVTLSLSADAPPGFDVLYRTTFRSGDVTAVLPDQAYPGFVHVSHTAASSYCYSLDAVRVATDELIHVDDGCSTIALPSLTVRSPNDDELRSDLGQCSHAPAGYEADWTRLGLQNAPFVTSGDASLQTSAPDAGLVSGAAASDDATADSGCSLADGSAVGGAWSALLAAAMLLLRRRRS